MSNSASMRLTAANATGEIAGRCPTYLLNIAKRSLPELILSGVGLASNDAVG
jgi:hypothetical protein